MRALRESQRLQSASHIAFTSSRVSPAKDELSHAASLQSAAAVVIAGFSDGATDGHPAPPVHFPPALPKKSSAKPHGGNRLTQAPIGGRKAAENSPIRADSHQNSPTTAELAEVQPNSPENGTAAHLELPSPSVVVDVACLLPMPAPAPQSEPKQSPERLEYLRSRRRGPLERVRPAGAESATWRGEHIGIKAAHDRVVAERGAASLYPCGSPHCAKDGEQWALLPGRATHCDLSSRQHYSTNPADYVPLCISCHQMTDRWQAAVTPRWHPSGPPPEQLTLPLDFDTEAHRIRFDAASRLTGDTP